MENETFNTLLAYSSYDRIILLIRLISWLHIIQNSRPHIACTTFIKLTVHTILSNIDTWYIFSCCFKSYIINLCMYIECRCVKVGLLLLLYSTCLISLIMGLLWI
uniref:Uncharacterized protein n=1 Tax=Austropuccinia psidii TaxID=181123 RepID=A0A513X044_9BASI|nr:hypothetical protein [Austropuccinia psidii]QDH07306.1 hypothetical protein [Austropuccinia psidii]